MKKIVIGIMLIISCFLLGGCGKQESVIEERNIVGGWDIDVNNTPLDIPTNIKEVFDNATSSYTKMTLTPISLVGTQVVSGTNYMFLCKGDNNGTSKWVLVTVYNYPSHNSEIKNVKYLNLNDYVNNNTDYNGTQGLGSWSVYKDIVPTLDSNMTSIFNKAVADNQVYSYVPIALLGEQVVAGTNYAFLALGQRLDNPDIYSINVLTVYSELDGNATLTGSAYIPLAKYAN